MARKLNGGQEDILKTSATAGTASVEIPMSVMKRQGTKLPAPCQECVARLSSPAHQLITNNPPAQRPSSPGKEGNVPLELQPVQHAWRNFLVRMPVHKV